MWPWGCLGSAEGQKESAVTAAADSCSGAAGAQHDFSAALGTYPPAQAGHPAVVADRQLFVRTLRALHDQLGTQFRIPMVSGRELDIHLLYKQVRCSAGSMGAAGLL